MTGASAPSDYLSCIVGNRSYLQETVDDLPIMHLVQLRRVTTCWQDIIQCEG